MSDWWSKKLTGEKPTAPRVSTPPTAPPIRIPQSAPQTPSEAPQTPYQGRQDVLDPNRAPTEQITMGEALRLWKGGEAMRKEGDRTCPECGSIYVFSRTGRGAGTTINGNAPAPRCYECGWNGMYDQGSAGSWG